MKRFEELYEEIMDEEKYTDEELKGTYRRIYASAWMNSIDNYQLGDLATGKVETLNKKVMAEFNNLLSAVSSLEAHKSEIDSADVKDGGEYFVVESYIEDADGNIVTIY